MWKRTKEKEEQRRRDEERGVGAVDASTGDVGPSEIKKRRRSPEVNVSHDSEEHARGENTRRRVPSHENQRRRRHRSRSQSPRRRKDDHR